MWYVKFIRCYIRVVLRAHIPVLSNIATSFPITLDSRLYCSAVTSGKYWNAIQPFKRYSTGGGGGGGGGNIHRSEKLRYSIMGARISWLSNLTKFLRLTEYYSRMSWFNQWHLCLVFGVHSLDSPLIFFSS